MTSVTFPAAATDACGSDENLVMSTDDESTEEDQLRLPVIHGSLNKWTNYLHGWQERFLVLKEGTLSYFKSPGDLKFGCRGAIRLVNAVITPHKYDECRFEVARSDSIWYLRACNVEERQRWVDALELHRGAASAAAASAPAESGYGSENNLRRQNSLLSLTSTASLSTASVSSMKRGLGLKEKLLEMETFKEILNKQVDSLQAYFDACAGLVRDSVHDQPLDDSEETEEEEDEADFVSPRESYESTEEGAAAQPPPRGFLSRFLPFGRAAGSPTGPSTSPKTEARQELRSEEARLMRQRDIYAILREHGQMAPDFKGNAFTFKATTAGILANLGHCIDLMQQREDLWRRRLEREAERRRRAEDAMRAVVGGGSGEAGAHLGHRRLGSGGLPASSHANRSPKLVVLGGPDLEEGPGCALGEEEFFDAVDAQLDKMAEDEERADELKRQAMSLERAGGEEGADPIPLEHPLRDEIERQVQRQLQQTDLELQHLQGWTLLHQNGDLRMYKRVDGAPMDEDSEVGDGPARRSPLSPLKAVHIAHGLTAKEVCRYFWDVRYRREWETALDQAPRVLELPGRQTVIVHQIYRRVWPATQRDACFWSQLRRVPDERGDLWMVVNRSTDHLAPPLDPSRVLRLWLSVAMVAQTEVPPNWSEQPDRSRLRCKVQYTAVLDPGGWVPQGAAKAIYEREYPKFLSRFTDYVFSKCKDEPPDL